MNDPLAPFRARFVARAKEELPLLRAGRDAAGDEALRIVVHRMAGLAGTVGYAEIGRLAARVDEALHDGGPVPAADYDALLAAIEAL